MGQRSDRLYVTFQGKVLRKRVVVKECKIDDGRRIRSGTSSRRKQTCNRANQISNDMNKIGRACWLSGTGTQRYSICMHWHCKQTSLSPHQKTTMRVRARKPSTSGYCAGGNLDCPRIKWTCCKRARSWKSKRRGTQSGQKEHGRTVAARTEESGDPTKRKTNSVGT